MLISVSQTASSLGVTVPTIRRWIRNGTLVAYKLGGQIRVKVADIDALLEAARIDPHVTPSPAPRPLRAPATGGLREMLHP
jgi:excisionase family DNA binding protein